ncbi:MAG: hypothetical protein PVF51_13680 [Nitrospirota bacterium]|jgi:hypothetical protein
MFWSRVLAVVVALCAAIPAGAQTLQDDLAVFGECIQQREQPRIERIGREAYRDDAWVPAPPPPTLAPEFPGVDQAPGDEPPTRATGGAEI